MSRAPRIDVGNNIYHVLNRASGRFPIFKSKQDYLLFEDLLFECVQIHGMHLLAYCIMPNHWHLVCSTEEDGQLGQWLKWLSQTHAQNWRVVHDNVGEGHLYQGRFKSFPVQTESYLLQLLRYVERNPLRAKLVQRAEDWQWGSLWVREKGSPKRKKMLDSWPIDVPNEYLVWVNEVDDPEQLMQVRMHTARNLPYGDSDWFVSPKLVSQE